MPETYFSVISEYFLVYKNGELVKDYWIKGFVYKW